MILSRVRLREQGVEKGMKGREEKRNAIDETLLRNY
jgi:hypothetical protein